jgi:hypothetical protein
MDTLDLLRPFASLAAAAFVVGFISYLAFTPQPAQALGHARHTTTLSSSSGASDWNFEKEV